MIPTFPTLTFQVFFFQNSCKETNLILLFIQLHFKYLLACLKCLADIGKCFLNSEKIGTQNYNLSDVAKNFIQNHDL